MLRNCCPQGNFVLAYATRPQINQNFRYITDDATYIAPTTNIFLPLFCKYVPKYKQNKLKHIKGKSSPSVHTSACVAVISSEDMVSIVKWWLIGLTEIFTYAHASPYINHVPNHNGDISISISIKRTPGFDILMLMFMSGCPH